MKILQSHRILRIEDSTEHSRCTCVDRPSRSPHEQFRTQGSSGVVKDCCCFKKNQNTPRPSEHPPVIGEKCCWSIQYLLFPTLQGKETNFRGHKLTQNKVQRNKNKIKKDPEKVPTRAREK